MGQGLCGTLTPEWGGRPRGGPVHIGNVILTSGPKNSLPGTKLRQALPMAEISTFYI